MRTVHPRHFVGTKAQINLQGRAVTKHKQGLLERLVANYAAPGACVDVYWLNGSEEEAGPVTHVSKVLSASYTLPGCSLPAKNGLALPATLTAASRCPKLLRCWVPDWPRAMNELE